MHIASQFVLLYSGSHNVLILAHIFRQLLILYGLLVMFGRLRLFVDLRQDISHVSRLVFGLAIVPTKHHLIFASATVPYELCAFQALYLCMFILTHVIILFFIRV